MLPSPTLVYILSAIFAGSAISLAIDSRSVKMSGAFASILLIGALLLSILLPISGTYFNIFSSLYVGSINLSSASLFSDGMSAILIVATVGVAAAVAAYAAYYLGGERKRGFFTLYLLFIGGLVGLFSSSNLLFLFLFLELTVISSWLMISGWGSERRNYAALKYFIYLELGAFLQLFGFILLGTDAGSFDLLSLTSAPALSSALLLAVSLIFVGILVKSAVFPLHGWLPDAYCEAAYPVTSILSFATVAMGGYTLIRILYSFAPGALESPNIRLALIIFGLINIFFGSFTAISQKNVKRLLAYSTISQVGYMLLGVASASMLGFLGVIVFAVAHGLSKPALFMISGIYKRMFNTEDAADLSGLAGRMPITSSVLLASFLSLTGLPPLLGFWGEFFVLLPFAYTIMGPTLNLAGLALVLVAVISTVFTAGYSLLAVKRILYGEPNELTNKARDPAILLWLPVLLLVLVLVVLGLYPSLLTQNFWIYKAP